MKRRRMRMRQEQLKNDTLKKQETVEEVAEVIIKEILPAKEEEEIIFLEPSGNLFEEEQKDAEQAAKNLRKEMRPKEPMAKDGKLLKKSKKSRLIGKKKNV